MNLVHVYDPKKQDNPLLTLNESSLLSKSLANRSACNKKIKYQKHRKLKTSERNEFVIKESIKNIKNSNYASENCLKLERTKKIQIP